MSSINITTTYNEIIDKLKTSNNIHIITELEKSITGAATGSEALMDQGSYLLSLKYSNPPVFKLIEDQINAYLKYCSQNGLIIK